MKNLSVNCSAGLLAGCNVDLLVHVGFHKLGK
jgi:hypothetical protein